MTLADLFAGHLSPSLLAMAFSVLLVVSLVAAEEVEIRRGPSASPDDTAR